MKSDQKSLLPGLVSVVLPVFNRKDLLPSTIDSVLQQTYRHLELLVVDDGSSDGSYEVATRYAAENPGRVRVLSHPDRRNKGVSATRNLGCRSGRGEYLAFIDSDDLWSPDKLRLQVEVMRTRPEIGWCYSLVSIRRSGYGANYIPGVETWGKPPVGARAESFAALLSGQMALQISTLVVRAPLFHAVGGFDEGLPFQNEDRLLVSKLCYLAPAAMIPESLCSYYVHDSSFTVGVMKEEMENLLEFDFLSRLGVWLASQPGGRLIAREVVLRHLTSRLSLAASKESARRYARLILRHIARITFLFPAMAGPFNSSLQVYGRGAFIKDCVHSGSRRVVN